jgi:uncharacterized protein YbaR (Trm112 family)
MWHDNQIQIPETRVIMLSQNLIDILACPACKGAIEPLENGLYLLCRPCGLKFPVRNGIPVMLTDEAETITERPTTDNSP